MRMSRNGWNSSPSAAAEELLTEATAIAERSGQEIASKFRGLAPHQRRQVLTVFRRQLSPPGKPGRKRSKEITAAYMDWMAGMRGLGLYRNHINRFDRMGHWERRVKTRALMDAIRSRKRREQRRRTSAPEAPPETIST
jgi:hypothetical protein